MTRKQIAVGVLLIVVGMLQVVPAESVVNGAFHSWLPSSLATSVAPWLGRVFWAVTSVGVVASGFGALGIWPVAPSWRRMAFISLASSLLMLALFWSQYAFFTLLLDLVVLAVVRLWTDPGVAPSTEPVATSAAGLGARQSPAHPATGIAGHLGQAIAAVVLLYLALPVVLRPWYNTWGTSEAELRQRLPGDSITREPAHQTTHAITVRAPASAVWPWLVQGGTAHAGLYTYDWLERAFGLGVHNAYRIVPEWQHLAVGDFVRAAPPDWLGGLFGPNVGFHVARLEPNQDMTWASSFIDWSFVLEPVDQQTTRLIVRTRVHNGHGARYYLKSLAAILAFEPAHYIMERKMLLTVKELVERS